MEVVRKIEAKLAELYRGAPKLSDSTKETLVKVWPWLALVFGILQVLAALSLFSWARGVDTANDFYRSIGVDANISRFNFWIWLGLIFLLVEGIMLLLAFPKLQKRLKTGWDLLFLVGLINVAYAIVTLFTEYRGGIFGLVWNLLVTAVIFWLLFAVRDKYKGAGHVTPHKVVGTPKDSK